MFSFSRSPPVHPQLFKLRNSPGVFTDLPLERVSSERQEGTARSPVHQATNRETQDTRIYSHFCSQFRVAIQPGLYGFGQREREAKRKEVRRGEKAHAKGLHVFWLYSFVGVRVLFTQESIIFFACLKVEMKGRSCKVADDMNCHKEHIKCTIHMYQKWNNALFVLVTLTTA